MIFRGRYEYTIDPKGMVNIPSRFRDQLSETGKESVVITNYEHCIYAYPAEEWERIEEKLAAKVSSVNRKKNAFVRFFVGGAVEVTPDKQGRILIPPSLRSYAGLDRDVVIIFTSRRRHTRCSRDWSSDVCSSD